MSESWRISIPSQGIDLGPMSTQRAVQFFNEEIAFYGRLSINGANIVLGNQNYGSVNLVNRPTAEISKIISELGAGKSEAFNRYLKDANDGLVLVGVSRSGKRVEQQKQINANTGVLLACILCGNWLESPQTMARDLIGTFRSIAFANPANFGFDNLVEASHVAKQSNAAWESTKIETAQLTKFIEEKTRLIDDLESLYRSKLTVQEPAISWANIAAKKTSVWRFWLTLFASLVAVPIVAGLLLERQIANVVSQITGTSAGGFSISGLAVISVPALFYAWLLKNVSRVFIQNLNLADDADHRRSLALTYMGLLQDDKQPTTDQERAIILNALFRPIPPHTADEGPPAGLLDLIKK